MKPADVSPGLLELEPGEVPPEYRLFFDQPVLKAYRYSTRPFNLKLALSPLAQGDSLAQVADRASLVTHISKEGQAITDARYFVKSRGNPNFRVTLPEGTALWSATVNGAAVVPVTDGKSNLIPLPQHADPDTVLTLDLKLAATSSVPARVTIAAPVVAAPVMLAEWKIVPDEGQRLIYRSGTLTPAGGATDNSGFAQIAQMTRGGRAGEALISLVVALAFLVLAMAVWRWATGEGVQKFSPRHLLGGIVGFAAIFFTGVSLLHLACSFESIANVPANDVTFLAPVQQPASALTVEVANVPANVSTFAYGGSLMLAVLAVVFWIVGWIRDENFLPRILGWTFLAWAALRLPNGAPAFLIVIAAFLFLHAVIPALKQLWRVPAKSKSDLPPPEADAPPVVAALLAGLLLIGGAMNGHAASAMPDSVIQQIRIENGTATATAKIHWQAEKGEALPLLFEPAVLTHVNYPKSVKLQSSPGGSRSAQQLVAQSGGTFDIEVQYQLQITKSSADSGFALPVPGGLVNHATLSLVNLNVDVYSPQAVSVQRAASGSNTVATLTLAPGGAWVGWKPRSRDVKNEKPVFYAELSQLYIPSAGVVEGVHQVSIRPAQGELGELVFDVPAGATVTDVTDGTDANRQSAIGYRQSLVSLWRFDPDARKLRVTLNPAQFKPFALVIRSQVATGTLPFAQRVGLISVIGAENQIGLLGVATGNEVQLDDVAAEKFSAINLEDFPGGIAQPVAAQFPGLTVRRAFRYSDSQATAVLKASAVEPDVRVETQDTLSLGEDRTVLASTANVTITRAGIFKLSFVMPPGFDVESISGAALSHWTEMKSDAGRVITLNLTGKTDGQQQFIVSLSGPGVKTTRSGTGILPVKEPGGGGQAGSLSHYWPVPQILFREAGKQRGTLLVVPEQGMRLESAASDGVTQLDPQKSGIRQKGVLAFRILETPWKLALNVEQVDPWIQVTSLQHATVNEAQVKVAANLQYQIENAGLKEFRVFLPANAEGVTFAGDQLSIFHAVDGAVTNGLQAWEIKLQRRVIGQYLLQANYQTPVGDSGAGILPANGQAGSLSTIFCAACWRRT